MFESLRSIFSQYITTPSRFDVHSVVMLRGENPEDVFYLCGVRDSWYLVYESDYIGPLSAVSKEAAELFNEYNIEVGDWLTKKEVAAEEQPNSKLVFKLPSSHLRYAIAEVKVVE